MTKKDQTSASSIGRRRLQARKEPSAGYSERREQLLRAAGEVFKRKGLDAASINDIAAELGSDRASVYYYYSNKDEIFHDLVGRFIEEVVVETQAIAATDATATEKLAQLIELVMDSYEKNYPYQYIYIQEDMTRRSRRETKSAARLVSLSKTYEDTIAEIVRSGLESREIREDIDPQLLTMAILGAVNWSHRWFRPGGPRSGLEIGREFAAVFLRGVMTTDLESARATKMTNRSSPAG